MAASFQTKVGRNVGFTSTASGPQKSAWVEKLAVASVWNLMFAGLYEETFGQTRIFSAGFYSLHVVDPLVVLSGLAAGIALMRGRFRFDRWLLLAIIVAALIVGNLVRGLLAAPASALIVFRGNGAVGSVLLMSVLMRPTPAIMRAAERALVMTAAALCVLIVLRHLFGPLLFIQTSDVTAADINDGGRPVSQVGAFIMVFAAALLLSSIVRAGTIRATWRDGLALLLPPMIVATGQATASIAAVIVLGVVFALERGPYLLPRLTITAFGMAGAALLVMVYLSDLTGNALLLHRAGNFETRSAVWHSLSAIWPTLSYTNQLFGVADGQMPKFFIYQNDHYRIWDRSMHSMYFGALPMMGYAGFLCFFGLLAMLLWSLAPAGRRRALLPAYPFALCVAIAVLSVSYEVRNEALIAMLIPFWWMRASQILLARPKAQAAARGTLPVSAKKPPHLNGVSGLPARR